MPMPTFISLSLNGDLKPTQKGENAPIDLIIIVRIFDELIYTTGGDSEGWKFSASGRVGRWGTGHKGIIA
jgi:hypothetical protein